MQRRERKCGVCINLTKKREKKKKKKKGVWTKKYAVTTDWKVIGYCAFNVLV